MLTITDILPLEEDPNYRVVYVDNQPEITIPTSTIEQLELTIGQAWTSDLATQADTFDQIDEAKHMALNLISRKAWGVRELAARLVKRGIDTNIALQITEQLEEDGWLDDFKYACARIRDWIRIEPASPRWLHRKLQERLLSQEQANEAIAAELGDKSEQDLATALAIIRLTKVVDVDEVTRRRRVMSALSRRGFSTDVGSEAIRQAQTKNA